MYKLLIKNEFWTDIYKELDRVKKRVYLQFMTYEGDKTGLKLSKKLIELSKKGVEVKILIDYFTDYFVNCKYYKDKSVKEERNQTFKMIKEMKSHGIEVKRTRPFGFINGFFLARNHKKIVVIDDICYLGGINVSDHNFKWYDFMVKIYKKDLVDAIRKDYLNNFSGKELDFKYKNILTNKYLEQTYHELIKNAENEIIISSPYILDLLLVKILKNKNIKKEILTLKYNNYASIKSMSSYLSNLLIKKGTDIFHYNIFSHAKFLLVDRKKILLGSSNFGMESFLNKQEIGILIEDEEFVKSFIDRMYIKNQKYLEHYKPVKKIYITERIITYLVYFLILLYGKTLVKMVKPIG